MAKSDAKAKLVDFLDRKAFQPVLHASPDRFDSHSDRMKLQDLQRKTETQVDRYKHYGSAHEVWQRYRDDLNSRAARPVHRDLKELGLPALPDFEEEFQELAHEVGAATS